MILARASLLAAFLVGLWACSTDDQAAAPASPAAPDGGDPPDAGGAGDADAGEEISCALGVLGNLALPAEIQATAIGGDMISRDLAEGGDAPLITPPQGGRVIMVGVRATNLIPCSVKLSAALRDVTSGQVRVDTRTVNLKPTGDGWGSSIDANIASFAHIPACPNQWADGDVFDREYELTVSVTDKSARVASVTLPVTPRCAEPSLGAQCRCICKQGYKLGAACP